MVQICGAFVAENNDSVPAEKQLKEFEGKETAQLVDRYKFLDLFPCESIELRSIGYSDTTGLVTNKKDFIEDEQVVKPLPRPDLTQMIPFKPKANAYYGEHQLPGGTFPYPPALGHLCSILPPPNCFMGPFVAIDQLMDVFTRIQLPDREFVIGIWFWF